MIAALIVIAGVLIVAIQIWQDRILYPRFKAMESTFERRRMYRYWAIDAFARYGLLGIVGLFLLHRQNALVYMPENFSSAWRAATAHLGLSPTSLEAVGTGLSVGLLIGSLIMCVVPFALRRLGRPTPPLVGDIAALIPRTPGEIRWGAVLSVNAGLSEEIFFRLLMPFAWFALTGNILAALLISIALFGLVHAYQGIIGVFATMAIGAVLMLVYLATQQIWLAMLLHAVIDLRALVVTPLASGSSKPT
jgi:uncharacterized protein